MKPATFWNSVLKANKAIQAGLTVVGLFVVYVATTKPDASWKDYLLAIPAYLTTHVVTYHADNTGGDVPVDQVVAGPIVTVNPDPAPVEQNVDPALQDN